MPRQRPLPKRPERSRIQTAISGDVHSRVDLYCARYGITEGRFFELAAIEKLDGVGDAKALARELKTLNEQIAILSEHGHVFFVTWLQNTQLFTPKEAEQARPQTTAAYRRFMQTLETNLSGGRTFLGSTHARLRTPKPDTDASGSPPPGRPGNERRPEASPQGEALSDSDMKSVAAQPGSSAPR